MWLWISTTASRPTPFKKNRIPADALQDLQEEPVSLSILFFFRLFFVQDLFFLIDLVGFDRVEGLAEIKKRFSSNPPKKPENDGVEKRGGRAQGAAGQPFASSSPGGRRPSGEGVDETPKVPNKRRRATAKKEEKPMVGVMAGRRARQSKKMEVEKLLMGVNSMLLLFVLKLASLSREAEEEKQEK